MFVGFFINLTVHVNEQEIYFNQRLGAILGAQLMLQLPFYAAACAVYITLNGMKAFSVKGEFGFEASFSSPSFEEGRLEWFTVTIVASNLKASKAICNSVQWHSPSAWFDEVAKDWRGWRGAKLWKSIEGDFAMKATCDSTGHVTLFFDLPGDAAGTPQYWSASVNVVVEAGQLERLAQDANEFFMQRV